MSSIVIASHMIENFAYLIILAKLITENYVDKLLICQINHFEITNSAKSSYLINQQLQAKIIDLSMI